MIQGLLETDDLDELYAVDTGAEQTAKEVLLDFEGEYPDVLKEDNLSDILSCLLRGREEEDQDPQMGFYLFLSLLVSGRRQCTLPLSGNGCWNPEIWTFYHNLKLWRVQETPGNTGK